jgi:hypothetical protein
VHLDRILLAFSLMICICSVPAAVEDVSTDTADVSMTDASQSAVSSQVDPLSES